jgi:DNA-directed RNA polymerase subunit RPC12/RpoP
MKTKKCITCGKRMAVSKFATRSDNGNLRGACKKCITAMAKVARIKRIEAIKPTQKVVTKKK